LENRAVEADEAQGAQRKEQDRWKQKRWAAASEIDFSLLAYFSSAQTITVKLVMIMLSPASFWSWVDQLPER